MYDKQSPRLTSEFHLLKMSGLVLGVAESQFDRLRTEIEAVSNRAAVLDDVDSLRSEQQSFWVKNKGKFDI
jgi:hypothetical protein